MTLILANIAKHYKGRTIFENISLKASQGQIIAIKGKSGVGKSTLLNIIAGLEVPSTGEVTLNRISFSGKSLSELSSIRGKHIGYISQHNPMIPKLTVSENITVPLLFDKSGDRKEVQQRMTTLAEVLQIEDLLHQKIEKLSGGELQRVGIIRALINKPQLIVADEPTASLDDETSELVLHCFNQLKLSGVTIVAATHNRAFSESCDVTYLLTKDGLIAE